MDYYEASGGDWGSIGDDDHYDRVYERIEEIAREWCPRKDGESEEDWQARLEEIRDSDEAHEEAEEQLREEWENTVGKELQQQLHEEWLDAQGY